MDFDTIEVSVTGAVGSLALARPDKLNPLSSHTLNEIERAARWSGADGLLAGLRDAEGRASAAGYLVRVRAKH